MREFEKNLASKLKTEAEKIVPESRRFDFNLRINGGANEENQLLNPVVKKHGLISGRRLIAAAAAVMILLASALGVDHYFENRTSHHSFQIISYADSDGMEGRPIEERLLDADISMVMPHGQIELNPDFNPQNVSDWAYGWGTGSFYVSGKDIARVTYSLKNGMISHYDMAMELKQNIEGNPVQIEFFLPYSALGLNETQDEAQNPEYQLEEKYTERLKELWNSGGCPELEAVKKGYFAGKSLNIEDYTIMNFVGTWSAAQTGGRYFRFRDIALDKQLNSEGHKVTVEYYHFDYGEQFNFSDSIYGVLWSPRFKPYPTAAVTSPADLPGDELTVTVELRNGDVIKKVIRLSFDKEGYVIAKIK